MKKELNISELWDKYRAARSRLIVLDQDGTLFPFHKDYRSPVDADQARPILDSLASDIKNKLLLISGRGADYLDLVWGEVDFALAAEHGAFYKNPGSYWKKAITYSSDWVERTLPALNSLAFHYEGSLVEVKSYSLAWHYRAIANKVTASDKKQILAAIHALPEHDHFLITDSEFTIELRTPGVDKGSFIARWIGEKRFDFALAVGDSETDEDMFRIFDGDAFTVKVGTSPTDAKFFLKRQTDVMPLIEILSSNYNGIASKAV